MINAPSTYSASLGQASRAPVYVARFSNGWDFVTARPRGAMDLAFSESGVRFNGATNYLTRASASAFNFGTGDFFLSMMVNRDALTGSVEVLAAKYEDADNYWRLIIDADGKAAFQARASASDLIAVTSAAALPIRRWAHVAVSCDRDSASGSYVWVDGTATAASSMSATSIDNTGALYVGQSGASGNYFAGAVAGFIGGKAALLTDAEAQWLHNEGRGRSWFQITKAASDSDGAGIEAKADWAYRFREVSGSRSEEIGGYSLTATNNPERATFDIPAFRDYPCAWPVSLGRAGDPFRSRFTVGELTLDLPDLGGDATAAIADGLRGARCVLHSGFRDDYWGAPPDLYAVSPNSALRGVCEGTGGRLCTVGDGGAIFTSDDAGETWTQRTAADAVDFRRVRYSSFLSLYVAVATGATVTQQVETSSDAVTWTRRTGQLNGNPWTGLCSAESLGKMIAVAEAGTGLGVDGEGMTSTDGSTWTSVNTLIRCRDVDWSETLGTALAVSPTAAGGGLSGLVWTQDGSTWELLPGDFVGDSVLWVDGLGLFLAVDSATGAAATWIGAASQPDTYTESLLVGAKLLAWSSTRGQILAGRGNDLLVSRDGRSWQVVEVTERESNTWHGGCFAAADDVFVAVASAGTSRVLVSGESTDYAQRFAGIVVDIAQSDGVYRVTARSEISRALSKKLWDAAKTLLNGAVNNSVTSLTVDDASGLEADTGYIKVDDEIIAYGARSGNNLTSLTRGALNTTAASHADDAHVTELFYVTGHPMDVGPAIMAGVGAKTGLGMASAVDSASWLAAKATLGPSYSMAWFIADPVNALEWLEREIFEVTATYPVESALGRIGVKVMDTPASFAGTVTDSVLLARPWWRANAQNQVNSVTVRYDESAITGDFDSTYQDRDTALIAAAGREFVRVFESGGLRKNLSGSATFIGERADSWLERFGAAVPVVEVDLMASQELLEQGDDIEATLSVTPDAETGLRSLVDAPMEIVGIRQDFGAQQIRATLMGYPAP